MINEISLTLKVPNIREKSNIEIFLRFYFKRLRNYAILFKKAMFGRYKIG